MLIESTQTGHVIVIGAGKVACMEEKVMFDAKAKSLLKPGHCDGTFKDRA